MAGGVSVRDVDVSISLHLSQNKAPGARCPGHKGSSEQPGKVFKSEVLGRGGLAKKYSDGDR